MDSVYRLELGAFTDLVDTRVRTPALCVLQWRNTEVNLHKKRGLNSARSTRANLGTHKQIWIRNTRLNAMRAHSEFR